MLKKILFTSTLILISVFSYSQNKAYKAGEIYTANQYRYGKMEFRMLAATGSGVLSNFFTFKQGSELSTTFWEEIDIEVFGKDGANSWQSNLITGQGNTNLIRTEGVHQENGLGESYHTYVIEWEPNSITWLVDGNIVRRINGGQATQINSDTSLRFNIWNPNIPEWVGPFSANILPVHMFVNWIKFYEWDGSSFSTTPSFEDNFNSLNRSTWTLANHTFNENLADFVPENATAINGYLVLSLTRQGETGYRGTPPVDDQVVNPINSLTVSSLNEFDADGASQSVTVSSNVDWTVSESSSWISINNANGSNNGSFTITANENTSTSDRLATVTVSGGDITRSITVLQEGADDTINNPIYTAIPSLIQAEDFDTQSGILVENTDDNGGGENVGYIDTGDFLSYNIDVPSSGDYTIDFRIASRTNGTSFNIFSGNTIIGNISSSATGGWQTWETVSETVSLNQGDQTIRLVSTGNGWNINWLDFSEEDDNNVDGNTSFCNAGTNLALNGDVVSFSSEENSINSASNVNDNNYNNRWSAAIFPQDITIDLGGVYNVDEINLIPFQGRAYQFTVQGSTTSANSGFITLTDATDNTSGGDVINERFSSQAVRFVKLTVTGASGYSGVWTSIHEFEVICGGTTTSSKDINEVTTPNEVVVYPNPVVSIATIEGAANSTIYVYDMNGSVVLIENITNNNEKIDTSSLSSGIYYVQANGLLGTSITKLIKQ